MDGGDEKLLSALNFLNPADLDYSDWLKVGMALKEEGQPCEVWDSWSKRESRYRDGECERKWATFGDAPNKVGAGSIIKMAEDRGWRYHSGETLDWDATVRDNRARHNEWNPARELRTFLTKIFEPGDYVGYVTTEISKDRDGKSRPGGKGVYNRTAGELLDLLDKHPEDIGYTIGDYKPEAGAWIRFNALDGQGVADQNVVRWRFALVESDEMPIADQEALYRKLKLPIATLVHSGGKSLHALVRVDAKDATEYSQRVQKLYDYLEEKGAVIDRQNKNPSRMTRMPGVTRNGNKQYIVATDIGCKSWDEWVKSIDKLPPIKTIADYHGIAPEPPAPLIDNILRLGHKMILSSTSKAGKSCLLMQMAVSLAEGLPLFGNEEWQCRPGNVLYINMEIDPASADHRIFEIYDALNIPHTHDDRLYTWNLRGYAMQMDELAKELIGRVKELGLTAIILDPLYKVIMGDENNASDMGKFFNEFDRVCSSLGCSFIYAHHHSKGLQGTKNAMDRASGSGVFARDPDALLDLLPVHMPEAKRLEIADCATDGRPPSRPYRLETSLREFPTLGDEGLWFQYPIWSYDTTGEVKKWEEEKPELKVRMRRAESGEEKVKKESVREKFERVYNELAHGKDILTSSGVSVLDMNEKTGVEVEHIVKYCNDPKRWGDKFIYDRSTKCVYTHEDYEASGH